MIEIKRNCEDVELQFRTSISLKEGTSQAYYFYCGTRDAGFAILLAERMNKDLEKYLLEVKRDGYLAGYKDGKNHKAKRFL